MIFVFGSNLAGIHGAGAALTAKIYRGFPMGIGEGFGHGCYALPTKNWQIKTLSLDIIKIKVKHFLDFAKEMLETERAWAADAVTSAHGYTKFQITRVGCGLAGLRDEDIAPMFEDAPINCLFDTKWENFLPTARFWGTF